MKIETIEDLEKAPIEKRFEYECMFDIMFWILGNKLKLNHGPWTPVGFEYLFSVLQEWHPVEIIMKGAQMGFTQAVLIKIFHAMLYNRFPQGFIYYFPTADAMYKIARTRFNPLIEENNCIQKAVVSTNAMNIKRIGSSWLYLSGAKATMSVGGKDAIVKDAQALRSDPADALGFDEVDLMDPDMVEGANSRLGYAYDNFDKTEGGKKIFLSTPMIPETGIHKLYLSSNQCAWMIRCKKCNAFTCLEIEFPNCINVRADGTAFRACKKCGNEIFPKNGRWVPQKPEIKDKVGRQISRLNAPRVNLGQLMEKYENPPNGRLQRFYNDDLGLPYIDAEDKLTANDIYACCGDFFMLKSHEGPTAMGFDIGKRFHVVIGTRVAEERFKIVNITEVSEINDVYDLAKKFHADFAVCDKAPAPIMVEEMKKHFSCALFGCTYKTSKESKITDWDDVAKEVKAYRNDLCDYSHTIVKKAGAFEVPIKNAVIETYANQMSNLARVQMEEEGTGIIRFTYIRTGSGEDHYRHATNYFLLAASRVREQASSSILAGYWKRRKNRTAMTA